MQIQTFDTTLRDGTQGESVSFSVEDKLLIAQKLDELGIDYIEGGWPGSNPKDKEFFERAQKELKLRHSKLTAFGSTRFARNAVDQDPNVRELLEWVGLGEHMNVLPNTMSGGQQQRIAIARAVITRPRLLLADEPTGNLDDAIGERLLGLFEQLNRMGTTLVIATHNQLLMDKFPHPRLILSKGHLTVEESKFNLRKKLEGIF